MNEPILFDFDGVIADSLIVFHDGFVEACGRLRMPVVTERETFLRLFEDNFFSALGAYGFPMARLPDLLQELQSVFTRDIRQIRLFPEMPPVLEQLAAARPIAIVSSNMSGIVKALLDIHGLSLDVPVLGSDRGLNKTDKIRQVLRMTGAQGGWFVTDTRGDLIEARKAGLRAVAVTWGWHSRAVLAGGLPDAWAESPGDLLRLISCKSC